MQFGLRVFCGSRGGGCRCGCGGTCCRRLHHAGHCARHGLPDACAHAQACADAGQPAFVLRRHGDGLGGLVLGEFAHVADDAHGDFFVECFLDVLRQADAFNGEVFQREAEFGKLGREQAGQLLRQQDLVGGHVEEGDAGSAEGGGKPGNGEVAQLLFELCAGVAFHNAADFFKEFFRVGDAVAVHAEGTQLYRAEFGIAHGNGLRRAPFAAELLFGVEKVNVGFERGLEEFVPVFQVG